MDNLNNTVCENSLSNYKDFLVYQYNASRTIDQNKSPKENLKEHVMAIGEEAGEVIGPIKKWLFHGHELDKEKVIEEMGDLLWELSAVAELLDIPFSVVAYRNNVKTKLRYPNGFEIDKSINREV